MDTYFSLHIHYPYQSSTSIKYLPISTISHHHQPSIISLISQFTFFIIPHHYLPISIFIIQSLIFIPIIIHISHPSIHIPIIPHHPTSSPIIHHHPYPLSHIISHQLSSTLINPVMQGLGPRTCWGCVMGATAPTWHARTPHASPHRVGGWWVLAVGRDE